MAADPTDPRTSGTEAAEPTPAPSVRTDRPSLVRQYLGGFSSTGLVVALLFYWISLTPSLIPRSWVFQGAISGISAVVGYGIGVLLHWTFVKAGVRIPWPARTRRIAWWTLAGATVIVVPTAVAFGVYWQGQVRDLFGMPPAGAAHGLAIVPTALVVALLLLQLFRGLRWIARRLTGWIDRVVPKPVARLVSVLVVAVLAVLLVTNVLWTGVLKVLNTTYASANAAFDPAVSQPTEPERSGSPASAQSWASLGAAGRTFVAGGPSVDEIRTFAARGTAVSPAQVKEPIRVYAGLDPNGDLDATADRAVAELDRTNAWDRSILVVATTTGTGWIDPGMADSLEYMHGGDTAIVTMQYSYLPSWISFVGDRDTPPAAGKALFDAVHARWSELPAVARPRLVVHGISLGSYGAQGAFSGLQDIAARSDGALFVGTPNFTPVWRELTDDRDAGSPEIAPVVDGGDTARWGVQIPDGVDLWRLGDTWDPPRVVYVQHASDGVVWWSPSLLLAKPDWLSEPRGLDVVGNVNWFPVVTFWQLTGDLFVAAGSDIPQGHGHQYRPEYADALAALWAPEGWSDADTARLKTTVADRLSKGGI
ncbi:alpha/beta hydrolase [Nakamurella sp.]|uniref:alpha/beta hydrolase n=1 Tax=Nakamurella sp. TaxID=1869182 RepID=UPI0037835983